MYLAEALTTMRPIVLDEEENKLRLHLVTGAVVKQGGDEVYDLLVVEVEDEIVLSMNIRCNTIRWISHLQQTMRSTLPIACRRLGSDDNC